MSIREEKKSQANNCVDRETGSTDQRALTKGRRKDETCRAVQKEAEMRDKEDERKERGQGQLGGNSQGRSRAPEDNDKMEPGAHVFVSAERESDRSKIRVVHVEEDETTKGQYYRSRNPHGNK